jgi:predicted acyltransferase
MVNTSTTLSNRLLSLDFMRGLIMILLALESTGLYGHLTPNNTGLAQALMVQFEHHPWHGLHFWDLVQPAFMLIAGTSMAFSLSRQRQQGMTWISSFKKTLKRSGLLFFWGVLDYAVRPKGLSFELWDVLTQLSFTTMVTFLIFRWPIRYQLLFCLGILVLAEIIYRCTHVPDFDQPFTDQHNFGNYIDWLLMHKINPGGWVAINCISTSVHTILGAVAGKILLDHGKTVNYKTIILISCAAICLLSGYLLDWSGITPIIKRIATSSFVLVSAGWCLLGMAACYYVIDGCKRSRYLQFFTIVGYNTLFIYLFFEIVGGRWFNHYISVITNGLMALVHVPLTIQNITTSLIIFMLEWGMCYFLYKKKIFFKL